MRRAIGATATSAVRLAARCEHPGSVGSLAAVWLQAAHDLDAYLQASKHSSLPRCYSTSAAAQMASSEPQRVFEDEAVGEGAPAAAAAATAPYRNCWQCGSGLRSADMFFCPDCRSIQPPENDAEAKYFDAFGM